jgi:hypothetical protein
MLQQVRNSTMQPMPDIALGDIVRQQVRDKRIPGV